MFPYVPCSPQQDNNHHSSNNGQGYPAQYYATAPAQAMPQYQAEYDQYRAFLLQQQAAREEAARAMKRYDDAFKESGGRNSASFSFSSSVLPYS